MNIFLGLICVVLLFFVGYAIREGYMEAKKDGGGSVVIFWISLVVCVIVAIFLCIGFSPSRPKGQYHNPRTGREQIQYQGSQEQQQDLNAIDNYKNSDPNF